jgi:hypothetical protein
MIAEAIRVGFPGWISYSRNKNWYSSAARQYLPRDFGYASVIEAVGRLEHLGHFDHDKKRPRSAINPGQRYQSRFRASARLLLEISETLPSLYCRPPRSLVMLRDEHGQLTEFNETAWTRAVARDVAIIEEALASIRLNLDGDTPCLSRKGDYLQLADRNGDAYGIHIGHVPICRIFNLDSWDKGGRLAGPPYQSWPNSVRHHITIDGEATEESDFGQTHCRMLCARADLDIDVEDIFNIPGFERDLVKRVFYILINAPSLRSALSAVADGERPRRKGTYATAGAITEAIKERFPGLAPFLHSGLGHDLMRLESDMAVAILLRLIRRGIVALPVHDSFIGQAQHIGLLEETMEATWAQFVRSKTTISRKQKPKFSAPLRQKVLQRV